VAVNTAVLAIPSVDNGFTSSRTPVQVLCYASILASVGSIILGLLVARFVVPDNPRGFTERFVFFSQYRTNSRETADEAAIHLSKYKSNRGLETLAIMYSLP
jgi:hypothetical protein